MPGPGDVPPLCHGEPHFWHLSLASQGLSWGRILPWELPTTLSRFLRDGPNVLLAGGHGGECDAMPVPVPTGEPAGTTLQDAEATGRVLTP